jgi:hypothetical protein
MSRFFQYVKEYTPKGLAEDCCSVCDIMLDHVRQLGPGTPVQRLPKFCKYESKVKWIRERRFCVTGGFSHGMRQGYLSGSGTKLIGT